MSELPESVRPDQAPSQRPLHRWSNKDAEELYGVDRWGRGYFRIAADGEVEVACGKSTGVSIHKVVEDLRDRGYDTPVLLRFSDILRGRIEELNQSFAKAIKDCGYDGKYRGVFPIKVNQARTVIEEIVNFGRPFHYGLEAGSKAELLAILALHEDPDALIVCNGYKDDEYIRMALLGSRLGRTVVLVAEKPSELDRIHKVGEQLGIEPCYGFRVKLSAPGAGKWQQSGGDLSKFGLTAIEILEAVNKLKGWNQLASLRLIHFHLGSQVSAIRSIKNALREAATVYVELRKLGCTGLDHIDVGGGLGVDYDGSQTNFYCSMNYSVQEYANDVVHEIWKVCENHEIPHPNIVSESGRSISAHHSVLVVNVLEVSKAPQAEENLEVSEDSEPVVRNFFECYQGITQKNIVESYHDALAYRDQALQLFNLGHLRLEERVVCDKLFWGSCARIANLARKGRSIPEELHKLERMLCDTYFLNFSLFQSLPDSWAIDQVFPILPIHRNNKKPDRRGVLADITCDSDGRIDKFADLRDIKNVLELHSPQGDSPYYLGIFLVGAYQEILGDMHNLFGDTHTAHISIDQDGYAIEDVVAGDNASRVLSYVNYHPERLLSELQSRIRESSLISNKEARSLVDSYRAQLFGYTYLEPQAPILSRKKKS